MSAPQPLYHPESVNPAYSLRYVWTGWLDQSTTTLWPTDLYASIAASWEQDGLRLLEHVHTEREVRLIFSAKPTVAPITIAQRAKGRLAYALRQHEIKHDFSRKVSLRSIGNNTAREVETYIENQVKAAHFVDPRFVAELQKSSVDFKIDLSEPTPVKRGRYWYDLHLVLVTEERYRIAEISLLEKLRNGCMAIAAKKGYRLSRMALMPDHMHLAIRGAVEQSPAMIVGAFQNNLAYIVGQKRLWKETYYAGTFGPYNMNIIRQTN